MEKLSFGTFANAVFSSRGAKKGMGVLHKQLMEILQDVCNHELGFSELCFSTDDKATISGHYGCTRAVKEDIRDRCARLTDISKLAEEIKDGILCAVHPEKSSILRQELLCIMKGDASLTFVNGESKADFLSREPDMPMEELLASLFLHVIKHVDNDWRSKKPPDLDSCQSPGGIRRECKDAICSQIEKYIRSDVYFEKHCRDVTYTFHADLKHYTRKVLTNVVLINPGYEDGICHSMETLIDSDMLPKENRIGFIRERYRKNLKITVNKLPIKEYLLGLGKAHPDRYGSYLGIDDSWDIYSLFSFEDREDSAGLVTNTRLTLSFPLDKNVKRHEITCAYVTRVPLDIGKIGYSFRVCYPCKYLEHKYNVRFTHPEAWDIALKVFEPFYSTRKAFVPAKKRAFTLDRIDKQTAVVLMDYLILPGTGYECRVLLKAPIDGGSLSPDFLEKSGLLGEEEED